MALLQPHFTHMYSKMIHVLTIFGVKFQSIQSMITFSSII